MNNFFKNKNEKGGAMITFLVFVFSITLSIVLGIVAPMIKEFAVAENSVKSKQSYFLAESGIEDAAYRIKNSIQIDGSETITLDGFSVVTSITDIGSNQKQISSSGDVGNRNRNLSLTLDVATGTAFNYGVQVGEGGLSMTSATINGNVYANGPIVGTGSSTITGSATSATSPGLTADQVNDTGTPSHDVVFGNSNNTQDIAQSFEVSNTDAVSKIELYIKKTGSPNNATVRVVNDSGGLPKGSTIATGTLSSSSVATSYGWIPVSFNTNPSLSIGTTYWIMIDASNSSSKYYTIGANVNGYSSGITKIGKKPNTWNNNSPSNLDYFFKVYTGGIAGLVTSSGGKWNPIDIGGDSRANTVSYTNTTGDIYCQTATDNNKPCTFTQPDPEYQVFPISDANIDEWKQVAEDGGIHTGNYSVNWSGGSLGPQKIDGNLSVSGGGTLNVTGPLWVTGTISLSGGGTISLDPSYGTKDGLLISDGTISIGGGGNATGSGVSGSYIVMITTSSSSNAASLSGGAGAVVLFAPNGTIDISGGASLKEATGYAVTIGGGATLTYESGLADLDFDSGPSGSWSIASWKETE